jgi:hypothetical protein
MNRLGGQAMAGGSPMLVVSEVEGCGFGLAGGLLENR